MSGAKVKIGKHQTGIITRVDPTSRVSAFSFIHSSSYPLRARSSYVSLHPSPRRHLGTRRRLSILIVSRLRCPIPSVPTPFRLWTLHFAFSPLAFPPLPPSLPLENFVSSFHRLNASPSLDLEPHSSHVQRWPRLRRHYPPASVTGHLRPCHSGLGHCIRRTVCC